ncbi:hypothetical protein IAU59_006195 [Kwoniella sp. CBS 9459]
MRYSVFAAALAFALPSALTATASPLDHLNMAMSLLKRGTDLAQSGSAFDFLWPFLSTGCQQVLNETLTSECPVYQCLHVQDYLKAAEDGINLNDISDLLELTCSTEPCSQDSIDSTIQRVADGCSTELGMFGYSADNFTGVAQAYEAARNAACLKTSNPYKPGDTTPPSTLYCPISLFYQYNETITSDAIIKFNQAATSAIQTGEAAVQESIQSSLQDYICVDCVFGILDVLEVAYPDLQKIAISQNATINGWLEGTCSAKNLTVMTDGSLPQGITQTATKASQQGNNTASGNDGSDSESKPQKRRHHTRAKLH